MPNDHSNNNDSLPPSLLKQVANETISKGTPLASLDRAAEIAAMTEIGFDEFLELTGLNIGDYSIFRICESGISIRLSSLDPEMTGKQAYEARQLQKKFSLSFPCSLEDFSTWYEGTKGKNGVSDISVAEGFFKTLGKKLKSGVEQPVASSRIIEVFKIRPDNSENFKWWNERMRSAKKYPGLLEARAQRGRARLPSLWHPSAVASWLIDSKQLSRSKVVQAVKDNFPDCNLDFL